jgi:adenosylcobinamide-GDP ribazoletransferase
MIGGLAVVVFATGWWAGPLAVAAAGGAGAMAWLALRKIGGLAGDVLGAIEQVVECLVLVTVSGLAARHSVWWG